MENNYNDESVNLSEKFSTDCSKLKELSNVRCVPPLQIHIKSNDICAELDSILKSQKFIPTLQNIEQISDALKKYDDLPDTSIPPCNINKDIIIEKLSRIKKNLTLLHEGIQGKKD